MVIVSKNNNYMKPNFLKSVLKNTLEKITTTLHKKSIEYVRNENPMHNFEQGAKITEVDINKTSCCSNKTHTHHQGVFCKENNMFFSFKRNETPKKYQINFDGNVLARIQVNENEIKIIGAIDGGGYGISIDKITITEE